MAGKFGVDSVLEDIADALFNGRLPDDWGLLTPDTCKSLATWIIHLQVAFSMH